MGKLKRPFDPIQQEYVERELQKLQAEQEMLRSAKGMGGPTDKMPTTGGSGQFGPAEFRYGGKKKYSSGSFLEKPKNYSTQEDKPAYWDLRFQAPEQADINEVIPETPVVRNNAQIVPGDYNSIALQEPQVSQPKQKFDWGEAGVLGAQLAGDIVGLGYSLRKPNYAKYQRISPSLVNYNQAATDITNQSGLMEQSTAQALRNQGQSSGAYLNNRINLASRLGQQTGAQLAELRMNEANTNTGELNKAKYANADIQRLETEANTKERDSKFQAIATHLGSIGAKVAGYSKDGKQMKMDKYKFDEAMRLYPSLFRGSKITQDKEGNYIITAN